MLLVAESHENVEDGVGVGKLAETDGVFGYQKHKQVLNFGFVLDALELGKRFDVHEESDDLAVHLFIGEPQIDDVLDEGNEQEAGGETGGLGEVPKQSEAHFVGENREVLVFEHFAGLEALFAQSEVLLVDSAHYFPQLLSKDSVLVHHLQIIYNPTHHPTMNYGSTSRNSTITQPAALSLTIFNRRYLQFCYILND